MNCSGHISWADPVEYDDIEDRFIAMIDSIGSETLKRELYLQPRPETKLEASRRIMDKRRRLNNETD